MSTNPHPRCRELGGGAWLTPLLALIVLAWAFPLPLRAAVALDPSLARMPVIERIVSAPVFEEPLTWVGEDLPGDEESEALWASIDLMREHGPRPGIEALEAFVETYPESVWTPSVRCNLAFHYRELGRYSLALEHWEAAWAATAEAGDTGGKRVADFTLAHWTRLLASLGRREALMILLSDTQDRVLDAGPLQERLYATQEGFRRMITDPGVAYRCGTLAVMRVGRELALPDLDLSRVVDTPSPETGFSLADLATLAADARLPVVPLRRPDGDTRLVIPSVVHWRQNHYAALVEARDDYVYVADPTFGHPRWLHLEVINAEASGYFLALPSQAPGSWSRVASTESRQIFGRGFPTVFEDNNDEGCPKADDSEMEEADDTAPVNDHDPNGQSECVNCPPGAAGDGGECQDDGAECGTCAGKGLAVWKVSEPYLSLWVMDTPLYYTTSHGKRTAFTLTYKQRNTRPLDGTWGMGPRWESSRMSYVRYNSGSPYQVSLFAGQGGMRTYTPDGQTRHYGSNTRMLQEGNSYRLFSGRLGWNFYGYSHAYYSGVTRYYQSQQVDKRGRITQLQHSLFNGIVRLNSIVDPDGRSVTLTYSTTYPERLVELNDPYGRKVELSYNASGQLSAIQDVHGLTSQFTYAARSPTRPPTHT